MTISVALIGSGRVATHLATAFAGHAHIQQIYSRDVRHAQRLADQVHAQAIQQLVQLKKVDVLIIAVSDQVIPEIAQQLQQLSYTGLVVHTSGSTDIKLLQQHSLRSGVLYPLQTFSFEQQLDWENVPFFLEAEHSSDMALMEQLIQPLSAKIYHYHSAQRLALHLAAVFACNFSNYCYDIAQQILQQQHVDVHLLTPLIDATAEKLKWNLAFTNQTGPAKRQDHNILELHHQILQPYPEWQKIYALISTAILNRHQNQS